MTSNPAQCCALMCVCVTVVCGLVLCVRPPTLLVGEHVHVLAIIKHISSQPLHWQHLHTRNGREMGP